MKKTSFILAATVCIVSCNQPTKQNENVGAPTEVSAQDANTAEQSEDLTTNFNIADIPFSAADLGDFPFFTLPQGLREQNKPLQRNFDVCFFPVNGIMTPFEGKLYKVNVVGERGTDFSQRYFEKSLEDYLLSVGAVKVFDGEVTREEYDRYNKQDPNKGDEGDIGYWGQQTKFYVLRSKDKGNIYVQFTADNASGKLNVLQEEAFQQTITKVTADEIAKDLTEKGKSILYINFDVDKSVITSDGNEVVNQIGQALQQETSLKISIEGHTDNTGNAAHNKKLSEDRANAVLNALTGQGIDKSRLSAQGFGSERPLVANDSEANKAKNRRVELVKTN
jgi:outer membrane protein OmpA-like peptidoglycan-associated protein